MKLSLEGNKIADNQCTACEIATGKDHLIKSLRKDGTCGTCKKKIEEFYEEGVGKLFARVFEVCVEDEVNDLLNKAKYNNNSCKFIQREGFVNYMHILGGDLAQSVVVKNFKAQTIEKFKERYFEGLVNALKIRAHKSRVIYYIEAYNALDKVVFYFKDQKKEVMDEFIKYFKLVG